jgi:hypothetical protein
MSDFSGGYFTGLVTGGCGVYLLLAFAGPDAKEAYDAGAKDALSGRLSPVVHIENGDTTTTYKLQWPD